MDKKRFKREGKMSKKEQIKLKKRKLVEKESFSDQVKADQIPSEDKLTMNGKKARAIVGKKRNGLLVKKKRKKEKGGRDDIVKVDQLCSEGENGFENKKYGGMTTESNQSERQCINNNEMRPQETDFGSDITNKKSEKIRKKKKDRLLSINGEKSNKSGKKKRDHLSSIKGGKSVEEGSESAENLVYDISSTDEDCSKGMKKWIMEYHQSRPGLKVLQDKIDEFIIAHEAQQEQARIEREAQAAEGGWTVVVHHKGRKKTTDSESGITVGSVAQAAVVDKMARKKSKEVGLDFYRFQRREAQRNELMTLQSKFEQDKKRIQQLRAARKFKPY